MAHLSRAVRANVAHVSRWNTCNQSSLRTFATSSRWSSSQPKLTHMDEEGRPNMVNVGEKNVTKRSATASGRIYLNAVAFELLGRVNQLSPTKASQDISEEAIAKAKLKGDPLVVAQLAGIMASKSTANIIPLCHPIPLTHVSVTLTPEMHAGEPSVFCEATAECDGKTGVEMEALTAVNVALLTVWDMLKAVAGRDMKITDLVVRKKSGGKSGDFVRA